MKRLLYIFIILGLFSAVWYGCKKKEELPGALYGVVTDKATGEPIKTAGVELQPIGLKTVTGTDGQYGFSELEQGTYKLYITKTGYADWLSNEIVVKPGQTSQGDVQLEKLPPALRVVNDKAEDIDELDFGAEKDLKSRSFNIFNNGTETLQWELTITAKWITGVNQKAGKLPATMSQGIVLTIERDSLDEGENITTVHITSNSGSRELKISAIGEERALPVLNTQDVTDVKMTSAVFHGILTEVGVPSYTERGFVYGLSSMPTIDNTISKLTVAVTEDHSFQATVTNLEEGKIYYVRAYAINKVGIAYSTNEVKCKPQKSLPSVKTEAITHKSIADGKVTLNATIVEPGEPHYIERGFVYGTSPNTMVENATKIKVSGLGTGSYSTLLENLQMGQVYYVRAYALNQVGIVYGSEVELDFSPTLPEVQIQNATNITVNSATLRGIIEIVGDPAYTERGFCYSLSRNPTIDNSKIVAEGSGYSGEFSKAIEGLSENKTYYVRAYVSVEGGSPIYSKDEISFHTISAVSAQVETMEATNVGVTSATLNGYVSSVGTPPYTERGFCYAISQNPTIYNYTKVASGSGESGKFSLSIDQLFDKTTYYYRAYVRTDNGEPQYGRQMQFTTQDNSSTANVSLTDHVALYHSVGFWFNPSANTVKYYWKAYRKDLLSGMSDQMIISDVSATGTEMFPSGNNYDWITDCDYQTTYTVCLVAYDREGKVGPLSKTNVATRSLSGQAVVRASVISCGGGEAAVSVLKGDNCASFSFYICTPFNEFISEDIPDIFWAMLFHKQNFKRYTDNQVGTYRPSEAGWSGLIAIGYNSSGEMSSIISKAVFNAYTGAMMTNASNSKSGFKTEKRPNMQSLKLEGQMILSLE